MFGPVFHMTSTVSDEVTGHPLDFQVDWTEDKDRKEAEWLAKPKRIWTEAEWNAKVEEGKKRADWELKHGRRWGY